MTRDKYGITIDEAIKHAREIADCCKNEISTFPNLEPYEKYCNGELEKRADEHEQLAEWLEELKAKRNIGECAYKQGYNKGINDLENKILNNCTSKYIDGERVIVVRNDIFKFILKQLKGGARDEI